MTTPKETRKMEQKLMLGLGIAAVISGILLILEKQYLIGISGSVVGAGLVVQNIKKIRDQNSE